MANNSPALDQRELLELLEEHRLANTTEPREAHVRGDLRCAAEELREAGELRITSGKVERRCSCARPVGVLLEHGTPYSKIVRLNDPNQFPVTTAEPDGCADPQS